MEAIKKTKGELTSIRILDAAEGLFASHGYDGTSLRQIAEQTGIKEPGLYNYFAGKQALYEAVLYRALNPMAEAMTWHLEQASDLRDYTELPSVMTDLLLDHPQIAALFQQAMRGDKESIGNQLMHSWLEKLFSQGIQSMADMDTLDDSSRESLAIKVIALFNITTGYFLAQRAYETMAAGELTAPENIARQKKLLHRVIRAMLVS
ncbi:MAG: AcrR family transcriptional regulator [Halioglobus sp.]|jgi:AcrR family transcriptional regulator